MPISTARIAPERFRPDPRRPGEPSRYPEARERIRVHLELTDHIKGRPALEKRLVIAIQQLASMGRTTIVKGCSGRANQGWRRTPLGGQGGMHFYLWWTPRGSAQAKQVEDLPKNAILLRAVRHHDNHTPLSPGNLDDYYTLSNADLDGGGESAFASPWTEGQQRFREATEPVRIVHGYPGSGKTLALWRAVESRGGKTLYLTWSSHLITEAKGRFKAFAPTDSSIESQEFSVFIGGLWGMDVPRITLAESRKRFDEAFEWWRLRDHLGPWRDQRNALHAELRAVFFGRAVPGQVDCAADARRLSDEQYVTESRAGAAASKSLLSIVKRANWRSWYEHVFPELAAAHAALTRIRNGILPSNHEGYDRVVVDEAQDLSLLESAVIVEYCQAIASKRDGAPWVLMAYDDGQTVRPSGFVPGRLKNLLNGTLTDPKEFQLAHTVRSPKLISDVIRRSSEFYKFIGKDRRPEDQHSIRVDHEVIARLIYVPVSDKTSGPSLIETLTQVTDLQLVSPRDTFPSWVPQEFRERLLTPESVKGLEYASVCVLDVGQLVDQISHSTGYDREFEIQARRTAIDGLRVALSRATENLVIVDMEPNDREQGHSRKLLKNPEVMTAEELGKFFLDAELPLDERILARCRDATRLVDNAPERAWQIACEALGLLGRSSEDAVDADEALRQEVCNCVLSVGARRSIDSELKPQERETILETVNDLALKWGSDAQSKAFASLIDWRERKVANPFELLSSALALKPEDREWLKSALPRMRQSLLRALHDCAANPSWADRYEDDVEVWLELVGHTSDIANEAEVLCNEAFRTLVDARKWNAAGRLLRSMRSPDPASQGRVLENLNRKWEAAIAFERAGLSNDALRNFRESGKLDEALRLAEGQVKTDLQWIKEMDDLVRRRPLHLDHRLSDFEKKALNKTLAAARAKIVKRKGSGKDQGSLF